MAETIFQDQYINTREASAFLGLSVGTLNAWRLRRFGPPFVHLGHSTRYSMQELIVWAKSQGPLDINGNPIAEGQKND